MKSLLLGLVLLGLVLLGFAAPGAAKVVDVHLVATGDSSAPYAFEPRSVMLDAGDSIRWVNDEQVFHTATSTDDLSAKRANGDWAHTLGSKGSEATQRFDQPGTFYYFCQPHASFMDGVITVTGEAGGESTPLPLGWVLVGLMVAAARRR